MHELPERQNANPATFADKVPKPTTRSYTAAGNSPVDVFKDKKFLSTITPLGEPAILYLRALLTEVALETDTDEKLRQALKSRSLKCLKSDDPDYEHDMEILTNIFMGGLYSSMNK